MFVRWKICPHCCKGGLTARADKIAKTHNCNSFKLLQVCTSVPSVVYIHLLYIYTLFDGLAYDTCGYFASFVVKKNKKIRAMSKISDRMIYYTIE